MKKRKLKIALFALLAPFVISGSIASSLLFMLSKAARSLALLLDIRPKESKRELSAIFHPGGW